VRLVEKAKQQANGDFELLLDTLTFTSKDIRDAPNNIGPYLFSLLIAMPADVVP
jgi:hypothetical protein